MGIWTSGNKVQDIGGVYGCLMGNYDKEKE